MNSFEDDDIEQFLADPLFRSWVVRQDEDLDDYWYKWLENHPDKKEKLYLAREVLQTLIRESLPLTEKEESVNIDRILESVSAQPEGRFRLIWVAAACVLVFIAAYFWDTSGTGITIGDPHTAATVREDSLTYVNQGQKAQLITLADGSTVLLQPNSTITHSITDSLRKVYLTGEAFFEITKNSRWPFEVETPHLTTHVLGTSFRVRDFENEAPLVRVNTGQVAVSLNSKAGDYTSKGTSEAVVLSSKELVTFHPSGLSLTPLIESETAAGLDLLPVEENEYVFKRTPVSAVFDKLTAAYGVEIIYSKETLSNCSLTARLGDEPLSEKLRMICLGLNLSLQQIEKNHYHITGPGCN